LWEITILHHLDDARLLELALEALVAVLELELEDVAAVAGLFFSADLKICSSAVIVVFLVLLHRPSNRPSTCGLLQTILQDRETESSTTRAHSVCIGRICVWGQRCCCFVLRSQWTSPLQPFTSHHQPAKTINVLFHFPTLPAFRFL